MIKKPGPVITKLNKPYWEGVAQEELRIQKCQDCGKFVFYPKHYCPTCDSANLAWVKASGRGRIYSFTLAIATRPAAFEQAPPYVLAVIKLEEGVHMLSHVVGTPVEELRCDLPVRVIFEPLSDELTVPKFRLV